MQSNKRAFSFVEIIIVIAIIALLGIIGMKLKGDIDRKSMNAKSVSYIETLDTSLIQYHEEVNMFPNPLGNVNYYGSGSEYVHIDDNTTDQNDPSLSFGKHGFITDNVLPKKYLNYLPLDPRTNQFYAYGKTTNNKFYEVAGVINEGGKDRVKLTGNYPGETGPYNLIREYNGPDFVFDGSTTSLPYNPQERLMTAQLDSISDPSKVTIKTVGGSTITGNLDALENYIIVEGDELIVEQGAEIKIFYSDGSQSVLGDTGKDSELTFANMDYKTEDNLTTRIQLALNSGTLWTKAPALGDQSEFEVYTQDTAASVRGTIFGIEAISATNTKIQVEKGAVAIKKVRPGENGITIVKDPTNANTNIFNIKFEPILPGGTITTIGSETGIQAVGIGYPKVYTPVKYNGGTSTGNIPNLLEEFPVNENLELEEIIFNTNSPTENNITVNLENASNNVNTVLIDIDGIKYLADFNTGDDVLTLTGGTQVKPLASAELKNETPRKITYDNAVKVEPSAFKDFKEVSISNNSEIQIYICNMNSSNKKLKCDGKKEVILNTTGKIKKVESPSSVDPSTSSEQLLETATLAAIPGGETVNEVVAKEAPIGCTIDGITIADTGTGSFFTQDTSGISTRCTNLKKTLRCDNGKVFDTTNDVTTSTFHKACNDTDRCEYDNGSGIQYFAANSSIESDIQDGIYKKEKTCDANANILVNTVGCWDTSSHTMDGAGICQPNGLATFACSGGTIDGYSGINGGSFTSLDNTHTQTITTPIYAYHTPGTTPGLSTGTKRTNVTFECGDHNGDGTPTYKLVSAVAATPEYDCGGNSKFIMDGIGTYCEPKVQDANGTWRELYAFAPYDSVSNYQLYIKDGNTKDPFTEGTIGLGIYSNSITFSSSCDGDYNQFRSFCRKSGEKGIFIDNDGNDDWLKYSGLSLGNDFIIEMSVKGSDLNRKKTPTFTLFSLYKDSNIILGNRLLYTAGQYYSSISRGGGISSEEINPGNLFNPEKFYSAMTQIKSFGWDFKVQKSSSINVLNHSENTTLSPGDINILKIGANSSNSSQWNGIINFIKIYN